MMKKSTCWLGLLMVLAAPSAQAANMEIKASFKPDSSQPGKNVFINQTPNSGYCADYPGECAQNNMFSLRLPVNFKFLRVLMPGDSIPVKAPANWRQLTVTNKDTGEAETVEVRITGIGSQFILGKPATELTGETDNLVAHRKLWTTSSWVNAPSPCVYSGVGFVNATSYRFFWKTPVEAQCVKTTAFYIPSMDFNTLDFAYELRTPNPLGMSSGIYSGSLTYTMGRTGDFSFGDNFAPDDDVLTLDFELDVQHTLKVDIPPGGEKIQLTPAGGWQSWLHTGRKPAQLFRDQTFNISASTRFKMYLECSITLGRDCELSDPDQLVLVPLKVSVTLPNGLTDTAGRPVQRQELVTQGGAVTFQPGQYIDRKPGTLHFELQKFDHIFLPGVPKQYSGNVVVIWDSEI